MYAADVYKDVKRAINKKVLSIREVAREFGLHRDTVRKMLTYERPPGYRQDQATRESKLDAVAPIVDQILEAEAQGVFGSGCTAVGIYQLLCDEYGFEGGYTIVKDYVRERRRELTARAEKSRQTVVRKLGFNPDRLKSKRS